VTRLLVVCTGNVCRSPAAERLLAARLGVDPGVSIASAGTQALVGEPIDAAMAALVGEAGADTAHFAARQLTAEDVRSADLVLAMTRRHREAVVALEPAAVRRTFLLLELAALAGAVAAGGWPLDLGNGPAARLAALPQLAPAYRGRADLPADPEVVDPYRRSGDVYAEAGAVIRTAVDRLVRAVR
jgi:protein-tyrosine phosphatase